MADIPNVLPFAALFKVRVCPGLALKILDRKSATVVPSLTPRMVSSIE